jgi:hypothetical protein
VHKQRRVADQQQGKERYGNYSPAVLDGARRRSV